MKESVETILQDQQAIREQRKDLPKQFLALIHKIGENIDQGNRLLQRSYEAKTDEILKQFGIVSDHFKALSEISERLRENGESLEGLRKDVRNDIQQLHLDGN